MKAKEGKNTNVYAATSGTQTTHSSPNGTLTEQNRKDLLAGKKVKGMYWRDAIKCCALRVTYSPDEGNYNKY